MPKPAPVFCLTGPPAAGKSTLALALADCFQRSLVLPVDDLRYWVRSGLADSVPWTEETESQFQIAEAASCAIARTYSEAGFAVVIDHCRNLPRWDEMVQTHLAGLFVAKVCLLPSLEVVVARSRARTNKPFSHQWIEETILSTHDRYNQSPKDGWIVLDSGSATPEKNAAQVLGYCKLGP